MKNKTLQRYTLITSVFLVVVVIGVAGKIYDNNHLSSLNKVYAATQPGFTFSGAAGWHYPALLASAAPTDLAVFNKDNSCFVLANQYSGQLDAAAQIKRKQSIAKELGYTMTATGEKPVQIHINGKLRTYTLHQFSVKSAPHKAKELGYIPVSHGYIQVLANCQQTIQLPSTIPALEAIEFDRLAD